MRAEQKAAAAEHSAAPPAVRALLLRPRGVRGDRPGPARRSALSEQPARRPNPPLSRAGLVPAALPARSAGASLAVLACPEGGGSLGAGRAHLRVPSRDGARPLSTPALASVLVGFCLGLPFSIWLSSLYLCFLEGISQPPASSAAPGQP